MKKHKVMPVIIAIVVGVLMVALVIAEELM